MGNFRYPYGNEKILEGELSWITSPIVAVLVGTQNYQPSSVHRTLADVPVSAIVATSGTLTGRTATLGVADADDVTWGTVPAGPARGDAVILACDTGSRSTSTLIAYFGTVVGVPVYPDGSNITVHWSNGASKIFVL